MDCVGAAGSAIGNAAAGAGSWAWQHKFQVIELGAAGACVIVSDGACLVRTGVAFGANTYHRAVEACSVLEFLRAEGITVAENALGGGPGLIKSGLGVAGKFESSAGSVLPSSLGGKLVVNGPMSGAAGTVTLLEPKIDESVPGSTCSCK